MHRTRRCVLKKISWKDYIFWPICLLAAGAWGSVSTLPPSITSAKPTSYTACAPSTPVSPTAVNYNWERINCYYSQIKMERLRYGKWCFYPIRVHLFSLDPSHSKERYIWKKSLHQGSVARQNKFKTVLYYHIGLVFFIFFQSLEGPCAVWSCKCEIASSL